MMIIKRRFLLLLSIFFSAQALCAQDSLPLSLDKAVSLSLQNNKTLKAGRARIDQAAAQLKQARDARLPDLNVSGSYLMLNHPNINLKTKDGAASEKPSAQPSSAVYGMATATVPLYAASKIKYGIEAARFLEEAVRLDAEKDRGAVILNTINAYTNLYKSNAEVNVVKENVAQSRQRDKDFQNLERNGLLARNDLLKAQLQTSNIELALVNAENNLHLCTVALNLMLGLPERTTLQLDSSSIQITSAVQPIENYEQLALSNRKDLQASALRRQAAETRIKQTRSDYYPSVGLTGGYIAADIPGVLSVTNALNAGVGVKYNLGSLWKTKGKMQEARAVEREIAANNELLEENIKMEINTAYENYFSSKKKMEVQVNALENARENNRITRNKYNNNLVNTTELLDAENALLESEINLENARADLFSAYHTLLESAGLLNYQSEKNN